MPLNLKSEAEALRMAFLRWQCRARQMLMRNDQGRPGAAIMPTVVMAGETEPFGCIVTVMNKEPGWDKVPEMRHMVQKTQDPSARRESALGLFSERYFQKAETFSDILTATFSPDGSGAKKLQAAEWVTLAFSAYAQRFDLACRVSRLTRKSHLYAATWWHNLLFNPALGADIVILGFEPDWHASTANPDPRG